ncbi:MAG TPA: hypothetical protein VH763_07775 [Gemmatimonadales bacterium]|jgi:hypothetical protein
MVEIDRGIPLARDAVVAPSQDPRAAEMEAGTIGESVAGVAALILAILGLLGLLPRTFAAIGAIVLGAGLLIGGATLSRRYSGLVPVEAMARGRQEIVGALGLQAIAGIAAIVLGILALLGLDPLLLLGITVLVLGAALVGAGGGTARLGRSARRLRGEPSRLAEGEGFYAGGWWEAEIGLGVVVLGILAVTGHSPLTLTLIALLSVGVAMLVSGSLLTARLFGYFG